ncbi:MAG: NAD-dependent epimerase/dehydratase family protein [Bacillota bacterium]|nr:NAD-dependent epimerase/dehydratase family protein [Bacillota bacterium]
MGKVALVVGATGLVGNELVRILLSAPEYEKVIVWVRTSMDINHNKLEEKIINFRELDKHVIDKSVNHVFCCLGTTMRKAKNMEAFATVDLEYPVVLAKKARERQVSQFLTISAMGADPNSKIFYNRIKGQLEEELKKVGLPGLHIFRPSLLLGKRKEFRLGEKAAGAAYRVLPFIFIGSIKKYKPIHARTVARAMYRVALTEKHGVNIYESNNIAKMT